jgi:trehalose 6-phosphate synthase
MRNTIAFILSIILAVSLVAVGFTVYQISVERKKLNNELEVRTSVSADEISGYLETIIDKPGHRNLDRLADSIKARNGLLGLALYYNADSLLCNNSPLDLINFSVNLVPAAVEQDSSIGIFFEHSGMKVYQYVKPAKNLNFQQGALVLYSDAGYIDQVISKIWFRNFIRWFLQTLLIGFVTFALMRWGIFNPMNKIVTWMKEMRAGNGEHNSPPSNLRFLDPLHKEIESIAVEMRIAKASAEEEARLRATAEAIWTPERLKAEMVNVLHNKKIVVVSNREPYMHIHDGKTIKCIVPASGMITAIEPVLEACGGIWIASGTGDADRETVNAANKVEVPPEEPKYTLKRVWLTKEEEDHYYYGFSNEGLWPLCHIAHTRPTFRKNDWLFYKKVNEDFARAVIEEVKDEVNPFILIQDYHFALLPELIKNEKPDARIALFWHIPWPNPESFGICPWQKEILSGMLGADLIGFHTQYHCNNFLETVNGALESRVLWENYSIKMGKRISIVKPFPISIAFTLKDYDHSSPRADNAVFLAEHGISSQYIGIGVDRIDYTKGIVEKFLAVERFLEKNPAYIEKFTFIQIGAPSRTKLKDYSDTMDAVEAEALRINLRFKSKKWKAIHLLNRHHTHKEISPFYASANFCMVTSLHDGMNLVAKEFVASRDHNDGVLILSRFTGAAQELQSAIIINPYDIEESADAIKDALEMSSEEQNQRMKHMRMVIVRHNIYSWAASILRTMASIN